MTTPLAAIKMVPVMLADAGWVDIIDEHAGILLPALAITTIVVLVAGVIHAWKTPEIAGAARAHVKGEIIRLLRNKLGWMTAQQVGEKLGLETHTAATLLEEMKRDGIVVSGILEERTHYRLKGV